MRKPLTLADLRPDPQNPREIDEAGAAGLGYSIEEFGDLSGIVFNEQTRELVCGHKRREQLAKACGLDAKINEDAAGRLYFEDARTKDRFTGQTPTKVSK